MQQPKFLMNRIVQRPQTTDPFSGLLPLHYNAYDLTTSYTSWQICNTNAASEWLRRWTPGGGNRASSPPHSHNGAPPRTRCVVTGQMTEANNERVRPLLPGLIGLSFNVTPKPPAHDKNLCLPHWFRQHDLTSVI